MLTSEDVEADIGCFWCEDCDDDEEDDDGVCCIIVCCCGGFTAARGIGIDLSMARSGPDGFTSLLGYHENRELAE
jgi:hypothetical protein